MNPLDEPTVNFLISIMWDKFCQENFAIGIVELVNDDDGGQKGNTQIVKISIELTNINIVYHFFVFEKRWWAKCQL